MADIDKILAEISPYYRKKAKVPEEEKAELEEESHQIVYDSSAETLEPVYFWILDFMNQIGLKVEKLEDNFASSPGSGHFSELMAKATKMQEEAMKIMQTIGILVKSIINIIYDLREFQIILSAYKNINSNDKNEAESARLSLKQRWMDQVDIKKGTTSIKGMAAQFQYVTLIDAFMAANSLEDAKNLDLNDRVKRILEARLQEYFEWEKRSGKELAKRYSIERTYLKSQVNSLKMYTRWAKPYLKAASQLEQKVPESPELINAFNTLILELTLLGTSEVKLLEQVVDKNLPESFRNKKLKRKYYLCVLVNLRFRGIPQRVGQHYAFGGKAKVQFKAYALNNEEYALLKKKMEDEDMSDALKLAQGMTDDSLKELKEDIDEFLGEEEKEKAEESRDTDPFTALFAGKERKSESKEEEITEKVKPDSYIESALRKRAVKEAKRKCFDLFDVYKKSHGMPSHPNPYDQNYIPTED